MEAVSKQPQYTYEEVVQRRLNEGSIDGESVKILLKRHLNAASCGQKYTIATDSRLKFSGLGLFTLEHTLTYAALIQCPVLNIRAIPGYKYDQPEMYQQFLNAFVDIDIEYHEVPGSYY